MSFVNTRAAASFVYIAFPLPATMLTAFARYLLGFDYIWGLGCRFSFVENVGETENTGPSS